MRPFIMLGGLLFVASIVILPRMRMSVLEPMERKILRLYIGLRLVMPMIFLYVTDRSEEFFDGGADLDGYVERAKAVANQLNLQGYSQAHAEVPGTGAVDLVLGHLFRISGADRVAATYFMSGLATIGLLVFWWSTRGLLAKNRSLYACLVLLAPTTVYWSASIGKEPLILLGIGCAVSAFMTVLDRRRRLTPRFVIHALCSVLTLGYIRPHIALLLLTAMLISSLISSSRFGLISSGQRRALVVLVALAGLSVVVPLSNELLGVNPGESLIDAAYERSERTAEGLGRSSYDADPVRGVQDVPQALALVLLRPFPWEARSTFQILASAEALAYMGLLVAGIVTVRRTRTLTYKTPIFVMCLSYVILFSSAVVSYGNIGLLVRQRMQVWPVIALMVALLMDNRDRRGAARSTALRLGRVVSRAG